ncbi:DegT/DnrJ/EryC1/StrS family aminotransferase [Chloroflexota bacterium]
MRNRTKRKLSLVEIRSKMPIPMTDLKTQYSSIKEEIDSAIQRVICEGQYILGPDVEGFEKEMAEYCGVKYAIGVASGTDALHLALLACGVKPGDEVITTPFTFVATAEAIVHCGAIPVFVDINHQTYNLDVSVIESEITSKTKAIIPVHLYGQPADMRAIIKIGRKYGLIIIEDCAQALGATYNAEKVGSIGDVGCLSFFPAKNLGAFGDGGMVVTNDLKISEIVGQLRKHGSEESYFHSLVGFNSRLDSLQAAILKVKLKYLNKWNEQRRKKAYLYTQLLSKTSCVKPPIVESKSNSSVNYYTIRLNDPKKNRTQLKEYLSLNGYASAVYYPKSLHLQDVFKYLGYGYGDFPESELAQEQVLSLPIFPEIDEEEIRKMVNLIYKFLDS